MRSSLAAARPRYGVVDVVALLFRELVLMIVIFLVIAADALFSVVLGGVGLWR